MVKMTYFHHLSWTTDCVLAMIKELKGIKMTRLRSNNDLKDITVWSCILGQILNNNDGSTQCTTHDPCWFNNLGPVYLQDLT